MLVSKEQLEKIYREALPSRLYPFIAPLNDVLEKYYINSPSRIHMFLAQIGHESGQFRYLEELATGAAYEGRRDLGNTQSGDGVKYKGRGVIQITGRKNYALCSLALDLPLLEKPELLSRLPWALESAGWYWSNNNLNSYCDKDDFKGLTKAINGGYNGYEDRLKLLNRAIEVIK